MTKGLIFDIRRFSVHDGPGIRTTIFFKGCPMSCWWCHNPESREPLPEISRMTASLDDRQYQFEEVIGREFSLDEVMEVIGRDRVFYETSGGGVTLSGGEPMFQPEYATVLAERLKAENYHVALDTCGYAEKEYFRAIMPFVDLFLYDLKHMDDTIHRKYTGVSNRLIHENLEILVRNGKKIIIRFPVIPGITDTPDNVKSLVRFLDEFRNAIIEVDLLPYHSLGSLKYKKLNRDNQLEGLKDLNTNDLEDLKKEFGDRNFRVRTGG